MSSFKKSFNLRNGVQVDNDNFVVRATGLVGIGSTTPTEFLDVIGNAKVSGLTTTQTLYAGIATVGVLTASSANISGVLTATYFSVGGVTFDTIVGYSTDAWIVHQASGSSDPQSGLYGDYKVGIGTTISSNKYSLMVGSDPDSSNGVSINSDGNIKSSGIITAQSFSGPGAGITGINASNIATGTINNDRLPDISVGIITATTQFEGNVVGIASTARTLTGSPNITVTDVTATTLISSGSSIGIGTFTGVIHVSTGASIGVGTASPTTDIQVRKSTGADLEVVSDSGNAKVAVGNSVGIGKSSGYIGFGEEVGIFDIVNNDVNGMRFFIDALGNSGTGNYIWNYGSGPTTLMTLTYDGNLGINQTVPTEKLHVSGGATFTQDSYFGSNVYVTGTLDAATLTGNITFPAVISGSNLNVSAGVSTVGKLIIDSGSPDTSTIGIGTATPVFNLDVGLGTAIIRRLGINTSVFQLDDSGLPRNQIECEGTIYALGASIGGKVGIGTSVTDAVDDAALTLHRGTLQINDGSIHFNSDDPEDIPTVGWGITSKGVPRSQIDMGVGITTFSYLTLPVLTDLQRDALKNYSDSGQVPAGAVIFNSDSGALEFFNGSNWRKVTHTAV